MLIKSVWNCAESDQVELITAQDYEEISFRASVVAKETESAEIENHNVEQKIATGYKTDKIKMWQEDGSWNPFFEHAIIREFYSFHGLKAQVTEVLLNGQQKLELSFTVSEF